MVEGESCLWNGFPELSRSKGLTDSPGPEGSTWMLEPKWTWLRHGQQSQSGCQNGLVHECQWPWLVSCDVPRTEVANLLGPRLVCVPDYTVSNSDMAWDTQPSSISVPKSVIDLHLKWSECFVALRKFLWRCHEDIVQILLLSFHQKAREICRLWEDYWNTEPILILGQPNTNCCHQSKWELVYAWVHLTVGPAGTQTSLQFPNV